MATHRRRNSQPRIRRLRRCCLRGGCLASPPERFGTNTICYYGCVAMGRSRCAIRQGALFGAQPQRAPLSFFAPSNRCAPKNFGRVCCPRPAPIEQPAQPNTSNIFVIRSLASRVSSFTTFCCVAFRKQNVGMTSSSLVNCVRRNPAIRPRGVSFFWQRNIEAHANEPKRMTRLLLVA